MQAETYIMRKFFSYLPLIVLPVFGAFGFVLRRLELRTVFDPVTGLAERFSPTSLTLLFLSLAVTLGVVLFFASRQKKEADQVEFYPKSVFLRALMGILALVSLIAVLLNGLESLPIVRGIPQVLWLIFGTLSGLGLLGITLFPRRRALPYLFLLPILFVLFWLTTFYLSHSLNPVILRYSYAVLAKVFILLSFYYLARFTYGRGKPRATLAMISLSVYFTGTTLADGPGILQQIVLVGFVLILLIFQAVLLQNYMERDVPCAML